MIGHGRDVRSRIRKPGRRAYRLDWDVMERRQLLSTYVVTNTSDTTSAHSLRWAILKVNSDSTADTIQFDIPSSGVQTIQLTSPLPTITQSVSIDGTTEPGYKGSPLIVIDGSKAGAGADGLVLPAGGNTVRGLALVGFSGSAIVLNSLGGNVVQSNFLGVNASGTAADPNGEGLSIIGSSANTIGGGSTALANVISGNTGNGIQIDTGSGGASDNLIEGNLIGTTADGLQPLGNRAEWCFDRRRVGQSNRRHREWFRQYHLRQCRLRNPIDRRRQWER